MNEQALRQFLNATRQYLFGLLPEQPALATIPLQRSR